MTRRPSFRQIAERLQRELYMSTYDYENEQEYDGVLTISYGRFSSLAGRSLFTKRLHAEVELEASRIGLIVAFGQNAIIIATDGDFASNGWSEIKPDPSVYEEMPVDK